MYQRFHGFDLHKRYASIMVRDQEGSIVHYRARCVDLHGYVEQLGADDAVVIESINNAFYWADRIEQKGATCVIVNPYRFKIIKESWHKTDKRDAANLSLALWMAEIRNEFKLPTVYKPAAHIRELRKLFSQYQMISVQASQHKNSMQAIFMENGIALSKEQKSTVFHPEHGIQFLDTGDLSPAAKSCLTISLTMLWHLLDQKKQLKTLIIQMGRPLEREIKLLITVKGVTPFLALAFLADVGDITRFSSARRFNAYLGVVPTVKSSGGKTQMGHINRQSRKLARSLFTQVVMHLQESSDSLRDFSSRVRARRGVGRSRIAVIRKTFGILRRMLLANEEYRWKDEKNFQIKLKAFEKCLKEAA